MLKEFRDFILRGNLVDLAVAVVIAAAFGAIVTAFVKDILTPLIAIPSKNLVSFGDLYFQVGGSKFLYGDVINQAINFVIVAAVIFFLIVKPMNHMSTRMKKPAPVAPPATKDCPFCLNAVPVKATRCGFCTSDLKA